MISVLIVDDSALARQALSRVLSRHADIEIIGCAHDPFHAAEMLRHRVPDVMVLDIEMPKMDGITFLRRLMAQHPIPTVICSSLAEADSATTMAALEAGAVDVIQKPTIASRAFFEEASDRIADVVRGAAQAKVRPRALPSMTPRAMTDRPLLARVRTTDQIIVIGSSTGGTEALAVLLRSFGPDSPATAIVQHMPPGFTKSFARRLDQTSRVQVKEAEDGDVLAPGRVLIAPGDHHLVVERSGARPHVRVIDAEPVNRHRPSVDVLFDSAARQLGRNCVGVILTGMGDDGARGMLRMREAGAHTIGQDEETSTVYGMPKAAATLGAVVEQLPLSRIAEAAHVACGCTRASLRPGPVASQPPAFPR